MEAKVMGSADPEIVDPLIIEAALHLQRLHRSPGEAGDSLLPDEISFANTPMQKMPGGLNNRCFLYHDSFYNPYCFKVYKIDERERSRHEWQALTALQNFGLEVASTPVFLLDTDLPHAIIMGYVTGKSLGGEALDRT